MTREELRVFLSEWFCGCGRPQDAAAALSRLLRLHPLYDNGAEFESWIPDSGVQFLLLYTIDNHGLTEHGGGIGGGWLTGKGEAVRDALAREESDGFEALLEMHCVHGFDADDAAHDCMTFTETKTPPPREG
jgi:hypothetical protein